MQKTCKHLHAMHVRLCACTHTSMCPRCLCRRFCVLVRVKAHVHTCVSSCALEGQQPQNKNTKQGASMPPGSPAYLFNTSQERFLDVAYGGGHLHACRLVYHHIAVCDFQNTRPPVRHTVHCCKALGVHVRTDVAALIHGHVEGRHTPRRLHICLHTQQGRGGTCCAQTLPSHAVTPWERCAKGARGSSAQCSSSGSGACKAVKGMALKAKSPCCLHFRLCCTWIDCALALTLPESPLGQVNAQSTPEQSLIHVLLCQERSGHKSQAPPHACSPLSHAHPCFAACIS